MPKEHLTIKDMETIKTYRNTAENVWNTFLEIVKRMNAACLSLHNRLAEGNKINRKQERKLIDFTNDIRGRLIPSIRTELQSLKKLYMDVIRLRNTKSANNVCGAGLTPIFTGVNAPTGSLFELFENYQILDVDFAKQLEGRQRKDWLGCYQTGDYKEAKKNLESFTKYKKDYFKEIDGEISNEITYIKEHFEE